MSGPLGPVEALERIAYLLERSQAPTYRVRAFRNAAEAAAGLGLAELERLAAAGRLQSIKGIGASTATVIAESLAGAVPDYLARLEGEAGPDAEQAGPQRAAVEAVLAALVGDCHTHSDWSDGGSPIPTMAATAADLGHTYLALTDHSPRLTVAHGLSTDRLRRQLDVVAELNETGPIRILTGIEVDILDEGALDADDGMLEQLDVVVASVHSKLRMDRAGMTRRMLRAVTDPRVDILGHCTGRIVVGRGRPQSEFNSAEVFAACVEARTAVEINCRPERLDPPDDLLAEAVAAGTLFAVDTDAHAPGQLAWQPYGAAKAVTCGVPTERIVNTWPLERLLAWSHPDA